LTGGHTVGYDGCMIEWISFLFGLGFSFLVYFRSIRKTNYSQPRKAFYFLFTFIGITGTLFLFGVLVADKLRRLSAP
jgi:uncharacterized membrane protein (DUF106 family)